MVDMNHERFASRLRRIEKEHRELSSGYVKLEERDGILVPVKWVRPRQGFPWRGLTLVLLVFVMFKALLFAYLGPIVYLEQHGKLENGTVIERMGAFVLRPDPATLFLSDKVGPAVTLLERFASVLG